MDRIKLFIPLIVFVLLASVFYAVLQKKDFNPQELPSALVGQPMPQFQLPILGGGRTMSEKDLLGKVYLLNVWATWCVSCKIEHPHLNTLAENGITIIGLNYKDESTKAEAWLRKLGNPYSVVIEDVQGKLGLDLGVYGAPETYLVDKKGLIRYKFVGIVDQKIWQENLQAKYTELTVE